MSTESVCLSRVCWYVRRCFGLAVLGPLDGSEPVKGGDGNTGGRAVHQVRQQLAPEGQLFA